jgi:hypothetical protein
LTQSQSGVDGLLLTPKQKKFQERLKEAQASQLTGSGIPPPQRSFAGQYESVVPDQVLINPNKNLNLMVEDPSNRLY